MASEFEILTIEKVNKMISFDLLTTKADGITRKYSDEWIDEQITDNELLVFGDIKLTYTTLTIPNNIYSAIRILTRISVTNQLIRDRVIKDQRIIDVLAYWKEILEPAIQNEQDKGTYVSAVLVDDYDEFQT